MSQWLKLYLLCIYLFIQMPACVGFDGIFNRTKLKAETFHAWCIVGYLCRVTCFMRLPTTHTFEKRSASVHSTPRVESNTIMWGNDNQPTNHNSAITIQWDFEFAIKPACIWTSVYSSMIWVIDCRPSSWQRVKIQSSKMKVLCFLSSCRNALLIGHCQWRW